MPALWSEAWMLSCSTLNTKPLPKTSAYTTICTTSTTILPTLAAAVEGAGRSWPGPAAPNRRQRRTAAAETTGNTAPAINARGSHRSISILKSRQPNAPSENPSST